jgi:hypothetical protein
MRAFVYLTLGLAMLFWALPNLPAVTLSAKGAFTISWLLLALLTISANLYYLIGVDREAQAKSKLRRWSEHRLSELRRGYFPEGKRDLNKENRRRYMS